MASEVVGLDMLDRSSASASCFGASDRLSKKGTFQIRQRMSEPEREVWRKGCCVAQVAAWSRICGGSLRIP